MIGNDKKDYLTQLYNRKWLFEDCPVCDSGGRFSIIYMDVDNFKAVNDLYGHKEGDKVLKLVADAIRDSDKEGYPVRMSGDEFVLVLNGARTREDLITVYERIVRRIGNLQKSEAGIALISLSAGIVTRENDDQSLQEVISLGDDAMYKAKREGKRRGVFYEDIREKILHDRRIEEEAPVAVENDDFELCFNPLLNMQNGMLEMTRVLAYWHRPDGSVLEPSEYRPVLEGNSYVRMLDIYLLDKLFKYLSSVDISDMLNRDIRFCIELSWLNFLDGGLAEELIQISGKYGVSLSAINISLAEQALTGRDVKRLVFGMNKVSELGISMSIKNYGSSFASVKYLNSIPVRTFLFDSRWLSESLGEPADRKLVKSVTRLTKDAHKQVIAIGYGDVIDTQFLTDCGCDAFGNKAASFIFKPDDYMGFVADKIPRDDCEVFDFKGDLLSNSGRIRGSFIGDGVTFAKGVSDNRGALHFSGGEIGENVVELPKELFARNSFSIALWVFPEKEMNWASAVYARYNGGFISFVPYTNADDGISVFRISVDDEGFFDTTYRAIRLNEWSHLCFTYDEMSESVRIYINGRKGPLSPTRMPTMIGCRQVLLGGDPFQKSYVGAISSLCIYSYALSDREVEDLYKTYVPEPGFCGSSEEYWMDAK
ncbi:MAG: diguanylate cyclase [Lachnospiraceae bacterium]|nr:diguanylate cyclase [Lachnospiraceae bacterium]